MADEQRGETRPTVPSWALVVLLILPVLGLVVLLARPELDVEWEHHPSHFWLVLFTAAVNVALASLTNVAATRYRDARLILVSLGFLASAGFLGLHALATPGVLLPQPNTGFVVATPIGLLIASVFAAASVSPLAGPRAAIVLRWRSVMLGGLVAVMSVWAVLSLGNLPPLDGPPPAKEGVGPLTVLAVVAVALYLFAAWRYLQVYRRPRSHRPAHGRRGVRAPCGGDDRRRPEPQLARELVGVARADAPRLRRDRAGRAERIPPERVAVGGIRRALPGSDARPRRSLARGRDRGRGGGRRARRIVGPRARPASGGGRHERRADAPRRRRPASCAGSTRRFGRTCRRSWPSRSAAARALRPPASVARSER